MTIAETTEFTFARTFDAPRALVWKAWTSADALGQWWGPKGSEMRVIAFDLRPGGMFHYAMAFQGNEMFGRFIYREVSAPDRLVYVSSFSDAAGGITRAPFPQLEGKWPLEILNIMTLTEEGGRTTVTLRGGPVNATEDERAMFESMTASMQQGFGGAFDKLDEYLRR